MVSNYDRLMTVLFAKADMQKIPLGGSFELTSRCTLDCKMCYIHHREFDGEARRREKDGRFWLDLATRARDSGMLLLLLTGGEPMLHPDFDKIYIGCKKLGLLVSVNTNATLVDDDKIRLFSEYPPARLNITLYGSSRETYERLCGSGEAYDRVVGAIKKLKAANVNIKLNYSIAPDNAADAAEIQSFAEKLDVSIQSVSYLFPPVRTTCGKTVRLSPAEAARAHFEWRRRQYGDDGFKDFLKNRAFEESDDVICGEKINCRAGLSTFWVTWEGEMTPCGMMTAPSVPAEDFGNAWREICTEREKILLPKECSACRLRKNCDLCAAVSLAENGRSDAVPPYACEKAHEYERLCGEFLNSG